MSSIIANGAEAIIRKEKNHVVKHRVPKGYRHPLLDKKLRTLRTRAEAKLLGKAGLIVKVPKVIAVDELTKKLEIEYISGQKLAIIIDKLKNPQKVCSNIGLSVAKIHDANIIHGDLTTSNMIYNEQNKQTFLIDFGLGFQSSRMEDKAVDLHVFREALEAKHPKKAHSCFKAFLKGYTNSINAKTVLKQLERVERRGRYKEHY